MGGDPRADRGADGAAARARGQPGTGQRGGSAGRDQPDPADPRALRRAAETPRRHPALSPEPAAGVREPIADRHRVQGRPADVRGQQRGHEHRHGAAQRGIPEPRQRAVAGRVLERTAAVVHRPQGAGRAGAGGDDRSAGDVRVRAEPGRYGALATRYGRAPGRSLYGDRPGRAAGRRGRDRRSGAAGGRRARRGQGLGRPGARDGGGQMNISALFIRRPVMTTLVMLGILMFGVMGYRLLPVSDLPNVDFPTILVSASLPGATPDTMASAVAMPLEKQFSTIAGLDQMTSNSSQGGTQITLQFALSRSLDGAAQDVQAAITKSARDLPQNMPSPPSYQKVNPADQPVLYLTLRSPTLPLSQVDEYAETLIAQRISTVTGVAQVSVYGTQKYAVRVQLDPNAMDTRQIGIDEAEQSVEKGNVNLPTGTLYGAHQAFVVQADGQLNNAQNYGPV